MLDEYRTLIQREHLALDSGPAELLLTLMHRYSSIDALIDVMLGPLGLSRVYLADTLIRVLLGLQVQDGSLLQL